MFLLTLCCRVNGMVTYKLDIMTYDKLYTVVF